MFTFREWASLGRYELSLWEHTATRLIASERLQRIHDQSIPWMKEKEQKVELDKLHKQVNDVLETDDEREQRMAKERMEKEKKHIDNLTALRLLVTGRRR